MTDKITKEKRSWNMSRIHGKDTKPEVKVRQYLFRAGYRYRKNVSGLPGKPDIVLPKYKSVIFVNGCYWHCHYGCKEAHIPKSNTEFWKKKLDRNVSNDKKHYKELEDMGWNVIVIWECEVERSFDITMKRVENDIYGYYVDSVINRD